MTQLVGILNITPDSFSDGGSYATPEAALAHAKKLLADGATMLDIGAESTRPGAPPLSPEEEWRRLEPVLDLLRTHLPDACLSLDTRHAETVRRALAYNPAWVNDVSGFTDPAMVEAVRDTEAALVVMHNLGVPVDKAIALPPECNPVEEVWNWLSHRIAELDDAGISRNRIIADPGIGFGKTARQSLAIIRDIAEFKSLGVALLVGHSEKSFLSLFGNLPAGQRGLETCMVSAYLAQRGVAWLRVHDVASNRRAITVAKELL